MKGIRTVLYVARDERGCRLAPLTAGWTKRGSKAPADWKLLEVSGSDGSFAPSWLGR